MHHNSVEERANPDPLVWETALSKIEGAAAPIVEEMRCGSAGLREPDFAKVLTLIAALHIGSPRARKKLDGAYLKIVEKDLLAYTKNKAARRRFRQRQERIAAKAERAGNAHAAYLKARIHDSPEHYLERLKSGDFELSTGRSWKIAASVPNLPQVEGAMAALHWSLHHLAKEMPLLIVGDCPVGFTSVGGDSPHRIGFGIPGSMLYVPIGPQTALLGRVDQELRVALTRENVLRLNTAQFSCSLAQCYAGQPDFEIYRHDGGPSTWSEMASRRDFYVGLIDHYCDKADEFNAS